MNTKTVFKEKMEAEVSQAQTELASFRLRGMGFTAKAKDRHDKHVAELEVKLDATKARLRNLADAEEHLWEDLKEGVESTWSVLQAALQDAVENFKTEPPIAGLHGSDETNYPYVKSLKDQNNRKQQSGVKQKHTD